MVLMLKRQKKKKGLDRGMYRYVKKKQAELNVNGKI